MVIGGPVDATDRLRARRRPPAGAAWRRRRALPRRGPAGPGVPGAAGPHRRAVRGRPVRRRRVRGMYRHRRRRAAVASSPTGAVEFVGRTDDQVKVRGFRIEPGEIEAALGREPGVRQVAVVADRSPSGVVRLVAYVVGSTSTAPTLRSSVASTLPAHMVLGRGGGGRRPADDVERQARPGRPAGARLRRPGDVQPAPQRRRGRRRGRLRRRCWACRPSASTTTSSTSAATRCWPCGWPGWPGTAACRSPPARSCASAPPARPAQPSPQPGGRSVAQGFGMPPAWEC